MRDEEGWVRAEEMEEKEEKEKAEKAEMVGMDKGMAAGGRAEQEDLVAKAGWVA